jgi:hypothetical protein
MPGSDRYTALFFLLLAVFICQQSIGYGVGTLGQPGPGLLSFGAGVWIGLLALVFLIQSFGKGARAERQPAEAGGSGQRATVVSISLSLFIYTLAVHGLGFILATLLFVLFLFRTVQTEPWWHSAVKAVLVTAGNYLLFVVWLGVRLPKGILPW